MTRGRLVILAAVALAAAQSLDWIIGAWTGWSAGEWIAPPWLAGGAAGEWFAPLGLAIALTVGAVVNVLGLIVFAMRRREWGDRALAAAQVGNILFSLVALMAVSPAWLLFIAAPALVTLVLVVLHSGTERKRAATI